MDESLDLSLLTDRGLDTVVLTRIIDGSHQHLSAPFNRTDSGRGASRRGRQRNDCTVRAVACVCGITYDEAYDILAKAGRQCSRGFHLRKLVAGETIAGFRFEWKACQAVKGQPRVNPVVFANQHPSGRHVLKTAGHVFACIDGVIHDTVKPLPTRCVYGFWEAVPVSK